jgi:hypothetical protein
LIASDAQAKRGASAPRFRFGSSSHSIGMKRAARDIGWNHFPIRPVLARQFEIFCTCCECNVGPIKTDVIPGRAKREPGISRFPDVQLHI